MSYSVQHNLQLRPFNTFGIRATAHLACTLDDEAAVDEVLELLREKGAAEVRAPHPHEITPNEQPFPRPLILSSGSNLLLARDLDEPVLLMRTRGRHVVEQQGDTVWLDVAAGEVWHDTVRWTLQQGYYGLENLALIPGRVGAAPWQNIGAYGVEAGERIDSVAAIHLQTGERRRFTAAECAFGYRQSFFKTPAGRDWLILSVRLRLSRTFVPRLDYAELRTALAIPGLTAVQVADTVEAIRRSKLPDPAVLGNAGSFFHNPVVDGETVERLRRLHPGLPAHPVAGHATPATFKLSAGWLIDACGWKGHREGDAGVSPRHALVLVNYGEATGQDILHLARRIQDSVQERFGVQLRPEPVVIL